MRRDVSGWFVVTHEIMFFSNLAVICLVLSSLVNEMFTFDVCTEDNSTETSSYYYKNVITKHCGCEAKTCVRKCCKPGFFYYKKYCRRNNFTRPFNVPIHINKTFPTGQLGRDGPFSVGVMDCRFFRLNISNSGGNLYVQEEGTLWSSIYKQFYKNSKYCVDELYGASALLCFPDVYLSTSREINVTGITGNKCSQLFTYRTQKLHDYTIFKHWGFYNLDIPLIFGL